MKNPIVLKDISVRFANGKQECYALKQVSISIPMGGRIAIVGPSGCGKSTLLNVMGSVLMPTGGKLWIFGKEMNEYSRKEKQFLRNRRIARIYQNFALVDDWSVQDNVTLPLKLANQVPPGKERLRLVSQALSTVGLSSKQKEKVSHLSGGEQQRVAIARALVQQAELILADEPTGALDTDRSWETFHLLTDLVKKEGKSLVLVTHNEEIACQCDYVYEMRDGRLL